MLAKKMTLSGLTLCFPENSSAALLAVNPKQLSFP